MNSTNPFNRIFHYCKLSTAIENILPRKELLLSPMLNTNDPRENKSFVFGGFFSEPIDIMKVAPLNEDISFYLREDAKVISFSKDNYEKNLFGFEYSKMWAHYGDNHKGICLELDKEEFLKENEDIINSNFLKEIIYYKFDITKPVEHKRVNHAFMEFMGKEKYLREKFRNENLDYLYYTKNKEWESEQEIRLLHFSENKTNEYCSIKKCLKNIFVGVDFNGAYLPSLISLCPDITISKLDYQSVRLIPKEIYNSQTKK